jgi:hypothetical protein
MITTEQHVRNPLYLSICEAARLTDGHKAQPPRNTASSRQNSEKSDRWKAVKVFASPSFHGPVLNPAASSTSTVQPYSHREQRWRLWRKSIGEWLLTAMLCGSIAAVLKAYSVHKTLTTPQKRTFNAIITGLSVGLGLNLIASLKSYAKMMRWRLLASNYRPLDQFDLIMGCHQQMNVLQLLIKARRPKYPFIPTSTQLMCLVWVATCVGAAILVAVLGLTYSLEQSTDYLGITTGNISMVELSYIGNFNTSLSTYYSELGAAYTYGIQGQNYWVQPVTGDANLGYRQSIQADPAYPGYSEYWFGDENPGDQFLEVMTGRYVSSVAACDAFPVINDYQTEGNVVYVEGGQNQTAFVYEHAPGGMTYISDTNSTCGGRCTNINVFQPMLISDNQADSIDFAQFFKCNNNISEVFYVSPEHAEVYGLPDLQARMLAGAIGWQGVYYINNTQQYRLFSPNTPQAPQQAATEDYVALLISQYSTKAIAAMDDHGPRHNISSSSVPISAVYLKVTWKYTVPLLSIIPGIHFMTLAAVIIWANKAIIKDEAYISMAKLYRPLIEELGPHGCLMRGDQIINRFGNPMVAYGFQELPGGSVGSRGGMKHVDIFRKEEGIAVERSFSEGDYDGRGWDSTPRREVLKVKLD